MSVTVNSSRSLRRQPVPLQRQRCGGQLFLRPNKPHAVLTMDGIIYAADR